MHLAVELTAYALTIASMWFAGRKSLWGPILSIADYAPWCAIALYTHTYSLIAFNTVYLALAIRQLVLWRRGACKGS